MGCRALSKVLEVRLTLTEHRRRRHRNNSAHRVARRPLLFDQQKNGITVAIGRNCTTCCEFPDVSPFTHSLCRLREKYVARRVVMVARKASSFIHASIRTCRV